MGDLMDRTDMQTRSDQLSAYRDDEIDLQELFGVLWDGKWWVIGMTIVVSIAAVLYALSLPNLYRSDALLSPANSAGGGLGGLAAQYGGLASLAGISLPSGGGADKTALGLQVLKSRTFIEQFIERRNIRVPLMAAKSWDLASRKLVINDAAYNVVSQKWVREVVSPRNAQPSAQESYKKFMKHLSVSPDKASGLITISISHLSPIVAQEWVAWLIEDINNTMRAQDITEAELSIEYLNEQVAATSLSDLQSMFYELIQSQTETIMLAHVRPEYVFKVVDPAIVPEEKAGPKRAQISMLGSLLGGVLSVLLVLLRHYTSKRRD
jgi:uncharacterized protein involved in exopolysaccharide biosynthesis